MSTAGLRPSRWTLRRRVLVAVLALLAVVAATITVLSVVAVDRVLTDRLDAQLATAVERAGRAAGRVPTGEDGTGGPGQGQGPMGQGHMGPGRHDMVPGFLEIPGQPEDTLAAAVVDGEVQRVAVLDRTGTGQPVEGTDVAALGRVPTDGAPTTVDLGPDLGDYRVAALPGPDGSVVVTGLSLAGVQDTVARLAGTIALVAAAGLLLAAVVGAALLRRALRPLDRVAATASRVAELPLDTGEVVLPHRVPEADTDPRTEVGQVGAALNRLLGHVAAALTARETSERQVRQFVADASHELRTPLTAIRGYAELVRRVPEPVPPDVAHALQRVESEAVRMSALVEDLLLLARLDSGPGRGGAGGEDRAGAGAEAGDGDEDGGGGGVGPHRDPVDLSVLLVDAVGDARASGPDHRWELVLPAEPLTVPGDHDRLHQVVVNLLSNARVHTPPGTTVTTALGAVEEQGRTGVRLSVSDDGPGIPAELLPHVFERFRRGDTSRSRGSGSSGLGLAIVAAVVQAHGGRVTATSVPGRTEFVVELPGSPPERDRPAGG
ncbi:sensor histidine kinase [Ornithinimicrobium cerasi]|uniref:sensor histidine kinase n=1 Tax=Ornithinimicrobium cerasi TaxID=2248773 RepID=UPI00137B1B2A|nr:HAMP domain-containing sensor histidine kinase [Ornithinimicrobium cerasi]